MTIIIIHSYSVKYFAGSFSMHTCTVMLDFVAWCFALLTVLLFIFIQCNVKYEINVVTDFVISVRFNRRTIMKFKWLLNEQMILYL